MITFQICAFIFQVRPDWPNSLRVTGRPQDSRTGIERDRNRRAWLGVYKWGA